MKRYFWCALVSGWILASILAPGASGQTNPCIHFGTGLTPPFPPGFVNCQYQMWRFGSYTCAFYSCPPPASRYESCPKCTNAGAPINLLTGNTFIEQNDVRIPG